MISTTEIDNELEAVLANIKEHEQALEQMRSQMARIQNSYIGLQGAKETLMRLKERIESAQAEVEPDTQASDTEDQQ